MIILFGLKNVTNEMEYISNKKINFVNRYFWEFIHIEMVANLVLSKPLSSKLFYSQLLKPKVITAGY